MSCVFSGNLNILQKRIPILRPNSCDAPREPQPGLQVDQPPLLGEVPRLVHGDALLTSLAFSPSTNSTIPNTPEAPSGDSISLHRILVATAPSGSLPKGHDTEKRIVSAQSVLAVP